MPVGRFWIKVDKKYRNIMEIRDPIHGTIHILKEEVPIVTHPFFQRLRNIKQLGFAEYIFPGATHSRFLHSIGVMSVGENIFSKIFHHCKQGPDLLRIKETFKLSCLLHDIGHAPLSHSTEPVMPLLNKLKIPKDFLDSEDSAQDRQATHEDYTIKFIAESSFTEAFKRVEESFGVQRKCIADLIRGITACSDYFTLEGVDYFPILHQLVSSELDCDRMDYLLRDSYFCGVSYGRFDVNWLGDNLESCIIHEKAYLGLSERAILTFEDFLIGRYHMFLMVYCHYRSVCLEKLLTKFFLSSPDEYFIPSDVEAYLDYDDYSLFKVLRASNNAYAKSLVANTIPEKLFESFNDEQLKTLEKIQHYLEQNSIDFIRSSSAEGAFGHVDNHHYPIKVVRREFGQERPILTNIDKATDLLQRFGDSYSVNRVYCDLDPTLKREILQSLV